MNVFFHVLGILYGYGLFAVAFFISPWYLLLMPISNLLGLFGHAVYERSHIDLQDAAFDIRAAWCLHKLIFYVLTGRYRDELVRLNSELAAYLEENRRISLSEPLGESTAEAS